MSTETREEIKSARASSSLDAVDDSAIPSVTFRSLRLVGIASATVFGIGSAGLLGWIFDIAVLKNLAVGASPLLPDAALGFVVASVALWLLRGESPGNWRRRTAQLGGAFIMVVGLLSISQYLFNRPGTGLLFANVAAPPGTTPARLSFLTAANFTLCGAALIFLGMRGVKPRFVDLVTVVAVEIALLALIGHACNVPSFYGWTSHFPNAAMAGHTAFAFAFLGAGLLCAHPQGGLMRVVTSRTAGGVVARRLLLAPVLIPLATGLIQMSGRRSSFYNVEFASWAFSFLNILVFTAAIWWIATLLFDADRVRQRAEESVRRINADLERRVVERTAELNRLQESLRDEKDRLRSIIDGALDAVITIDNTGSVTGWSRQACSMFGWEASEVEGRPLSEIIIPPRYRAAHERGLKHFAETGEGDILQRRIEITALHRSGKEIPVELSITPLHIGGTYIFSAFVRDITDRKRAEAEISSQSRELRLIFDTVPAIIFYKDAEHRILQVNQASARCFGRPPQELEGRTDEELGSPYAQRYRDDEDEIIRTGLPKFGIIEPVETPGGTRWLQTDKFPHRDDEGNINGIIGFAMDITERREAEENIRRLNAELEQRVTERTAELKAANDELEAFAYSVSHDLRAPLRAMGGYAGILKKQLGPDPDPDTLLPLDRIRENATRMSQLIDGMLAFSKLARQPLTKEPVEPEPLVRRALDELRPETTSRTVQVEVGVLPPCEADATLLHQVFANLLSNAVKYTRGRDPAVIKVAAQQNNGQCIYCVQDNGAGFDMAYAAKLFRVFQRLHTLEEFEGTGVGLAIVQRIIHRHGGQIWAESNVGKGATFYFTLDSQGTDSHNNNNSGGG